MQKLLMAFTVALLFLAGHWVHAEKGKVEVTGFPGNERLCARHIAYQC